jgi:hypothetical protein
MKRFIVLTCLLFACNLLFAEEEKNLKGQIMLFNEKANEEIIITNNTFFKDAFKIYVHTKNGSSFHFNGFYANYTSTEEGWQFLVKTTEIKNREKWKSSTDFEVLELSDYICIESKSGRKYNYTFETKHDKLYITVDKFQEGDDW